MRALFLAGRGVGKIKGACCIEEFVLYSVNAGEPEEKSWTFGLSLGCREPQQESVPKVERQTIQTRDELWDIMRLEFPDNLRPQR